MLSNLKLSAIEKKLAYLRTILKTEGKFLAPTGMKLLNKQLREVKAQLAEAQNRVVVGKTKDDGSVAYLHYSVIDDKDIKLLYIEGLPTGWDSANFDMTSGNEVLVCVDGDQKWNETIIFN